MAVTSVAATVLMITASAAFASNTGSATGSGQEDSITTGSDFGVGSHPHCLEVTASSYSVALSGTFSAGTSPSKSYTGSATFGWSAPASPTTHYFIDEDGTYTTADHVTGCDLGTRGTGILSTITLSGGNTTNGISCTSSTGNGHYGRTFNGATTVTFTGSCTVYQSGNSATTPSNTTYTLTGTMNPCLSTDPNCTQTTVTSASFSY
jgi:hypothetical protein